MSRYVDIDIDTAMELYKSGHTLTDIGKKFGCSYMTVKRRLKSAGVAIRKRAPRGSMPSSMQQLVHEYVALGMSTYELGEKYGVNHATISKWVRKRGHRRGKGGGSKAIQGLNKGREVHKESNSKKRDIGQMRLPIAI